ncbi:putative HTH-type transcriptional regulator YqhC [Formosimonas limnophila]|uniref:Putative HTH-type transcriptional regulator YqhC n=2 Tax=Formosimonas limnophila TaxID=1384487 RepID=A0A8J3FZK7_9BURK|nr:putative HTH-type transcriptional regulator YqhC [Formosimonas limnophila]
MPNKGMKHQNTTQLARTLYEQLPSLTQHGIKPSGLKGVSLFFQPHAFNHTKESTIYNPRMVILFSGAKIGELGLRQFRYDAHHFLVLTSHYPLQCTTVCQNDEDLLGMTIELDREMVAQLIHDVRACEPHSYNQTTNQTDDQTHQNEGLACYRMSETLRERLHGLLSAMANPMTCTLFGQAQLRWFLYEFMSSSGQGFFESWIQSNSQFQQFHRVVEHINETFAEKISVADLAHHAAMSETKLNRLFKKYMADTPLQYLKKVRLHQARAFVVQKNMSIGLIAQKVGYESQSQFCREFKRYFSKSPTEMARAALHD